MSLKFAAIVLKMSINYNPVEADAVEYFRECLENYDNRQADVHNFRGHIGQAPWQIRNYINENYPGNEFRNFLKSHPEVFYVWYGTVSINRFADNLGLRAFFHLKKAFPQCFVTKGNDRPDDDDDDDDDDVSSQSEFQQKSNNGAGTSAKLDAGAKSGPSTDAGSGAGAGAGSGSGSGTTVKSIRDVSEMDDVISDFENLLTSQTNSDVAFKVDAEILPAHKLILGARSSVFAAMFAHPFQESSNNIVTISDISSTVMKDLLQFIYTGKIKDLSTEKALGLYKAADKYDLKKLREKCREVLMDTFNVDNVCEIAVFADLHNDGKLCDAVKRFIQENINNVLPTKSWSDLVVGNSRLVSDILISVTSKLTAK